MFAKGSVNSNQSVNKTQQLAFADFFPDYLKHNMNTDLVIPCLLMLILLLLWHRLTTHSDIKRRVHPPGPWGLPFLGNLLSLGSYPHLSLTKMAKKYGPVFKIRLGQKSVVVLTGLQTTKQALVKQAIDFAGRPDFESFKAIAEGKTMAFNTYSLQWKTQRKIQHVALRTFLSGAHLENLEKRIAEEAEQLVKCLTTNGLGSGGHMIDPNEYVRFAVANIICLILFGKKYGSTDVTLQRLVTLSARFTEVTGAGNPADIMPWTKIVPSVKQRQADFEKMVGEFDDWIEERKREHEESYQPGVIRDLTDHLVKVLEEMDQEEMARLQIDHSRIMKTLNETLGAGFETVATSLLWSIMYMMAYPDVQSRVQKELDRVVGPDRTPCLADKRNLHFTQACIHEILRITSVAPMAIPHSTTCDTNLNGFFIPKDTLIFVNLWGTNHDETIFENPDDFNPDRFMTADGSTFDRSKSDKYVTFSLGRRRCLGEPLAHMEVFLFFTTLMHRCTFQKENDDQILDFKGNYGLTIQPDRYRVLVNPR
ncbi:cytochrome P450 1A1-like [Ptychodera flava]|uniref:cytochrome P450 1A1-like n=1 Tax=Ptychodera flava TaxID=63121 RepID=UPI003969BF7F